MIFTDDNVGFVLGAIGSISALVTMGVMIRLHNRKQDRWVHTRFTSQKNQSLYSTGATKLYIGNMKYK